MRITGLAKHDRLIGIDARPATGAVYALGDSGQLYTVDPKSGKVTKIGVPVPLGGKAAGFDFNPTVDRIRLVTDTGQLFTVGRLGLDITSVNGFDIGADHAVAAVRFHGLSISALVKIDPGTGHAKVVAPLLSTPIGVTFVK
ncbi:DUF4394 domain-containing protein [Saccharothrix sp. AJ9571]|nr:DUF4394 domain-containing protein [Saccharothrix sp. AJ9571]